jgi:hypothetical protein
VRLEGRLERYPRHASGIVRDRRRGDDGDDLESEILAEAGGDESVDVLIVETTALFDQGFANNESAACFMSFGNGAREWPRRPWGRAPP